MFVRRREVYDAMKYVLPSTEIKLNTTLRAYGHLESEYTRIFMVMSDIRNTNKKYVIIFIFLI